MRMSYLQKYCFVFPPTMKFPLLYELWVVLMEGQKMSSNSNQQYPEAITNLHLKGKRRKAGLAEPKALWSHEGPLNHGGLELLPGKRCQGWVGPRNTCPGFSVLPPVLLTALPLAGPGRTHREKENSQDFLSKDQLPASPCLPLLPPQDAESGRKSGDL